MLERKATHDTWSVWIALGHPQYWLLFLLHEVYNPKALTLLSTLSIDETAAVGIELRESSEAGRDTWGGVWDLAVFRRVSLMLGFRDC